MWFGVGARGWPLGHEGEAQRLVVPMEPHLDCGPAHPDVRFAVDDPVFGFHVRSGLEGRQGGT
jgi:hypothetical protein